MKRWLVELKVLWDTQRPKMISLGVLALAFLFMFGRNVVAPNLRSASAAAPVRPPSGEADAAEAAAPEQGIRETVECPPPPPFERDVFAFNRAHFPLPAPEGASDGITPKSARIPDEETPASVEPTPEQIAASVRQESGALELRSLIVGGAPLAVIEVTAGESKGRHVVGPGDTVGGFRVAEVRRESVVLEKDGVSVELFRTADP